MPELPEVETIKNDLKRAILNKQIASIVVRKKKIIKNKFKDFEIHVKGSTFTNISRIGKLIIFHLKNDKYLLIHLKMTGQLIYKPHLNPLLSKERRKKVIAGGHEIPGMDKKLPNKYSHVIFNFSDKSTLYFNDMRRFGYLRIVDEDELKEVKSVFGIEPLTNNFKLKDFKKIFKNRKINVKSLLLNQKLVAGIGNIYVDEILFKAGVGPTRVAGEIKENEMERIFKASEEILKKAIKYRGTTFSDYVDSKGEKGNFTKLLKVYGRDGKECKKCGKTIKKIKVGGRGTRYCPKCQI